MSSEDWQVQRDAYKLLGDEAYGKDHDYHQALQHYTAALSLDPEHPILLCNRSAVHLKLNNISKALRDAEAAISFNPKYVKAHNRRAMALSRLLRFAQAIKVYQHVLKTMDSNNTTAQEGIEYCQQSLEQEQQAKKKQQEKEETSKPVQREEEQEKKDSLPEPTEKQSEDDMLDDFFSEIETPAKQEQEQSNGQEKDSSNASTDEASEAVPNAIQVSKASLGTAPEEIQRIIGDEHAQWKNANPFHVLQLPHTSTREDISRRAKALSLLLHPDKFVNNSVASSREDALLAFQEVQKAKQMLLDNPDKARHIQQLIQEGLKRGHAAWKKLKQTSSSSSLATCQEREVQRLFAEMEYQRHQVQERERKYEQRQQFQQHELEQREQQQLKHDKTWRQQEHLSKRIGNWRDFSSSRQKRPKTT